MARTALAARWLGLGLLWSTAFLTVAAPSLARSFPGCRTTITTPSPTRWSSRSSALAWRRWSRRAGPARRTRWAAADRPIAGGVASSPCSGWNLTHLPPGLNPDGGFPAGEAAGDRVDAALTAAGVDRTDVILQSLPDFKSTEAMVYPLARLGRVYVGEAPRRRPGSLDPAPRCGRLVRCWCSCATTGSRR